MARPTVVPGVEPPRWIPQHLGDVTLEGELPGDGGVPRLGDALREDPVIRDTEPFYEAVACCCTQELPT